MGLATYSQVPELYATYVFTGPDGTRAVLNNSADADYVGTFSEDGITGLDSAEIRENAWDLVEADGGVHGNFWLGRRPVTAGIDVLGTTTVDRNTKMQKLKQATRALRADGILTWTTPNTGGAQQRITYRTQQPLRWTGAWKKTAFVALVCADARIYSNTISTSTINPGAGYSTLANNGDYNTPPSLKINGPGTNPTVTMNGFPLVFQNTVLSAGEFITIDLLQRTVTKSDGTNLYGRINFGASTWSLMGVGNNQVKIDWVSGSTGASTLVVTWRDAWA